MRALPTARVSVGKSTSRVTMPAMPVRPVPRKKATPASKSSAGRTAGGRAKSGANKGTSRGVAVGVGLATVDLLCVAPRLDDRIIELSTFTMQGGGSTANMLATLAVLGARTRVFSRLGDDDFGRFALAGLRRLGVDTSLMALEPGKMSPMSVIQIDELTRKRKILFTRGNATPLAQRDLPRRLLEGAGMLVIDGYQPALQAAIAEKARSKGIPVLLNAGHLVGGMGELLALSDVVIGSERFAGEFAPSDDIETSLREITRIGPRVAVITLGTDGAMALEGDKVVRSEAVDVFVADTTGAGDAFCGAFGYAVLAGWPLERALPFANAAAGLKCRTLGAQAGLPTLAEVADIMDD